MTHNWIEVSLDLSDVSGEIADAVREAVTDRCGGLEELHDESGASRVRGYCVFTDDGKARVNLLSEHLRKIEGRNGLTPDALVNRVETRTIQNVDWATNWKQYYTPQRIGERFIVHPSWEPPETANPDDLLILMDPGQAFGTGQHETTRLCIELMETLDLRERRVADIGCGSGILSIAAVLLGADSVTACDIDATAVETAISNAGQNQVADSITVRVGSVPSVTQDAPFDIVMANIISEVLIEIHAELTALMKPGGFMIWSGIIEDRKHDIEDVIRQSGLRSAERRQQGEWLGYILELE